MEQSSLQLAGVVFAILGAIVMAAAVFDWNYFMTHYKAKPVVWLLGRNGARVFYGLLGAIFVGMGLAAAVGLLGSPPGVGP